MPLVNHWPITGTVIEYNRQKQNAPLTEEGSRFPNFKQIIFPPLQPIDYPYRYINIKQLKLNSVTDVSINLVLPGVVSQCTVSGKS